MKSIKKLLRYAVPGIALMLLFGFALACGGRGSEKEKPLLIISIPTFKVEAV